MEQKEFNIEILKILVKQSDFNTRVSEAAKRANGISKMLLDKITELFEELETLKQSGNKPNESFGTDIAEQIQASIDSLSQMQGQLNEGRVTINHIIGDGNKILIGEGDQKKGSGIYSKVLETVQTLAKNPIIQLVCAALAGYLSHYIPVVH